MARVVLAMSGGVDSSVAAWLLRHAGHEVIGLFMRHGVEAEDPCIAGAGEAARGKPRCCSAADAADARRVADVLDIPFYALNFEEDFDRIVEHFVDEYAAGRTPNPCILCNTWLKFGRLFEYAESVDARYVATGHHARLVATDDVDLPALCRGRDAGKEQSYVLFGIDRRLLGRLLFPVGEHRKEEIRRMAGQLGLRVAGKQDSQEICFVPDGDHARLVRERRPHLDTSGEIVTTDGTVVGRHDGLERFTVGQRKGLGIAFGERRFVVRLEPETRRVVVGTREELARTELTADGANWLVQPPSGPFRCQVKIRYRSRAVAATVRPLGSDRFSVRFDEPRHGVAPGQAAVCYDGDRVLGGGWIE
ncbi:MAG TPA: tRNA 2-thiouridine(34) synthase MnmA [Thermoguttaceae bacterium]|nr:tRNA 2-thiouridine(34) synthase MnmA [Thermoguttaceae bacterium]